MSNFTTWGIVSNAITGTAPTLYVASTPDSLATILAAGYLNDKSAMIKLNDKILINYADLSTFPLNVGENALYAEFNVIYAGGNYNLVPSGSFLNFQSAGSYSKIYVNAGGSATTTIPDSRMSAGDVVIARWRSQANASEIETVAPGVGQLVVVSTADPGASVLEYIVVNPSQGLVNFGVDAKQYTNAGGSATTVITDANITASSVVTANWLSQANAVEVEKVTPSAGTLTILSSGDPGASVLEYVAIQPSLPLQNAGLYAAKYSYAGGSATVVITDANITAASVVVADLQSSANAVIIKTVLPAAGQVTIVFSGNPGASVISYQATPFSL